MKIVYCIPGIYASAGTERVVINKANYLVAKGYEVTIITTDQDERKTFFSLDDRVRHYDLRINYFKSRGQCFLKKFFLLLRNRRQHQKRLETLLLKLQADVVISLFGNEMGFLPYMKDGSKKLLEFHFCRPFKDFTRRRGFMGIVDSLLNRIDISYIKKYDKFVVLTEEDKANWPELSNICVIYNASSISHKPTRHNGDVIAVGRYTAQKGFERLIDVWGKVKTDKLLRIYGDGELKDFLKKKISDLNLANRVFLEAPTSNMLEVYSKASVLVMTSLYEGLPMVMIEAQSCGIPVVSFDFPCGPKDVIDDGVNGFIISNGSIDIMARRIQWLIDNDDERFAMGENAKKSSLRFDKDRIMHQWCELFENL